MESVLLIDDDASILELVSSFLGQLGYDVKTAHNGEEGIELLKSGQKFHIVITDIRMPKKNGNEVARYIRDAFKPDNIPIIAITGFASDIEEDLFDFVLEKPFKIKDMADVIESLL